MATHLRLDTCECIIDVVDENLFLPVKLCKHHDSADAALKDNRIKNHRLNKLMSALPTIIPEYVSDEGQVLFVPDFDYDVLRRLKLSLPTTFLRAGKLVKLNDLFQKGELLNKLAAIRDKINEVETEEILTDEKGNKIERQI